MGRLIVLSYFTSERTTAFHYEMFHGRLEDASNGKLAQVSRNGWRIPDIFCPSNELVISDSVRKVLQDIPHLRFELIEFAKLIDYPYVVGDDSYYGTPDFTRNPSASAPETLIDRLPDKHQLHSTLGQYFQLFVPLHKNIITGFDKLHTVKCRPSKSINPKKISVSEVFLKAYPIFWWGYYFLSESAFAKIEPFLDYDYFEATTVSF